MPPTLSVVLPNYGSLLAGDNWREFVDVAVSAENAGVDRVIVVDHVVMGRNTDAYVWGRFPTPPDSPWLEPLTVLTLLAGATSRVRLGTGILIAPLRGAAVLAKTAATLDVLSGGRLDLGVGTGWQAEEYAAAGLDFGRRGQLLSDTLAACKALWTDSPAAVELRTLSFTDTWCEPKPVQPGGVPLWVSGSLVRPVIERVVRWGDGWIPIMTATTDDIREGSARLRQEFAGAGRDPSALQVRGPLPMVRTPDKALDLDATLGGVAELVDAGVTDIQVTFQALSREPAEASALLADLAKGFAAATSA